MSPSEPTPEVIERRLALQRDQLAELDRLLPLDAARLANEPITRAAVERIMQGSARCLACGNAPNRS